MRLSTLFWCGFASSWSSAIVNGQFDYCEMAEDVALSFLVDETARCVADLSSCSPETTCTEGCAVNEATKAVAQCFDGCVYSFGEATVKRFVTAGYGADLAITTVASKIVMAVDHYFLAGPEGNMTYQYEALPSSDALMGGPCEFTFNGAACVCTQNYCDDAQTTYANYIDCSAFPGGGIIDLCNGFPTDPNAQLSDLEFLFWIPTAVCSVPSAPTSDANATSGLPPPTTADTDTESSSTSSSTTDIGTTGDEPSTDTGTSAALVHLSNAGTVTAISGMLLSAVLQ